MKRLLLCAAAALAVSLVLAPAALASVGAHHSDAQALPLGMLAHARTAAPVGDTGPYSITGNVLDFSGAGVAGANVYWGFWTDATGYNYGGEYPSATDTTGSFSFSNISGGHTFDSLPSDELDVSYPANSAGLEAMFDWSLDFATTSTYPLQPAEANVTLDNSSDSDLYMRAGSDTLGYCLADVPLTSNSGTATGVASVLPNSNFDDLTVYPVFAASSYTSKYTVCQAAVEWSGSAVTVAPGDVAGSTVTLDTDNAQYAWLYGPMCRHSGAAGRTVTIQLLNWPKGEIAGFNAWWGTNFDTGLTYSTTKTVATSGATVNVPLNIYPKAPVGVYEIDAYRTYKDNPDSLLDMWDLYQVTTFKASASTIYPGHAVRLSGAVPGTGKATVYSITKKPANQPSTTAAKGWHRVARYTISSRKFKTGLLHPTRTTWYVVEYKGYAFPAFSQIVKVTVR